MKLLGIVGSLRHGSFNRMLLEAVREVAPLHVDYEVIESEVFREIPAFDEDLELQRPESVQRLANMIRATDAVIIATPEYNSSISGALKNALDWLSRPLETSPLRNKHVGVVGASTSAFGAVWAQAETRKVLRAIGARVMDREVAVAFAQDQFDARGHLSNSDLRRQLGDAVRELCMNIDRPSATASAVPRAAQPKAFADRQGNL